jgi:nucleoside-diphosphate-sugar epimerase
MTDREPSKNHFLVVAAASRGARFFVKKALRQGHDVTALCRAKDDEAALARMKKLLGETHLAKGGMEAAAVPGVLYASNGNIVLAETYRSVLSRVASINRVCCFVGVTTLRQMMSRTHLIYTKTIQAIVDGMQQSRWVEFYYHGSSGTEGVPGQSTPQMPGNFKLQWLLSLGLKIPAAQNCFDSENILAKNKSQGLKFVVFRPAWLTTAPAQRSYGFCFDTTGIDNEELSLRNAKTTISREDVAEEILRVAILPEEERKRWYGHGIYLVDLK